MPILRCDGCGATFPATPEGREVAEAHVRERHSLSLWPTLAFVAGLAALGAAIGALVGR